MYYLFEVWAERLVEAFVNEAGKGKFEELEAAKDESDLRLSFYRLGIAYLSLVTRPDIIAMTRLIIGEAARQPELCRIFYGNGARRTLLSLGVVMQILIARGLLRQADPYQTGLYFKSLCEAGLLERQLWGLDQVPDVQTLHTTVRGGRYRRIPSSLCGVDTTRHLGEKWTRSTSVMTDCLRRCGKHFLFTSRPRRNCISAGADHFNLPALF